MDVLSSSKEKIENVRRTLGTLQKELSDYYLSSVQNTDGIPESQKEAMASMRLLLNDALGNLSNSVKSVKALTGEKEEKVEEKKYPLLNDIVKQQFEDKDAMYIFKEDEENYCIYGEKAIQAAKILDVEPWLKDVTIGTKTDKALPLPVMSIEHFLNILEVAGIETKLQKEDMTFETRKSPLKQDVDLHSSTEVKEAAIIERQSNPLAKDNVKDELKDYVNSFRKHPDDIPSVKEVLHPHDSQIDLLPKSLCQLYAHYETLYEDAYTMQHSRLVAPEDKEEIKEKALEAGKAFRTELANALGVKEETEAEDAEKLLYSTLAQESLFDKVLDVPEEIKADFKGKISAPHYVVFDDSFPLKPCFYYSYNDAAENASLPTKKSQIPDNFFEKINKRLNSSEPIRYYLPSVDIPVYAVKALIDGKLDGLTEKEKKDISAYIGKTGAGIIYARNEMDKPIHLPFPAFGPAADCQVLDRYVNVVPRELKDVYVSDDGRLHPKKYTMNPNYDGTFNIVLLHDIGNIPTLKKGEIGGVIHTEKNLSHEGRCWVFPGGEVSGQARVEGNAFVEDGGKVEVFAKVEDAATIYGRVGGNSKISGDTVVEKSEIIGYDSFLDDFRQGEAEDIDETENIHRGR